MPHSVHSTPGATTPDTRRRDYWNINIPQEQSTEQCPDWLFSVDGRDREILATPDSEYKRQSWARVRQLVGRFPPSRPSRKATWGTSSWSRPYSIGRRTKRSELTLQDTNRLDLFERVPSDLRRYLHYIYNLKHTYGSVLEFIQHKRLHWDSVTPSLDPHFTNSNDYKILWNDWPYGLEAGIAHIVVWTKFLLDEDRSNSDGDLTKEARNEIEAFVRKTFCYEGGLSRDQLVWFKNWRALKSVHAIGQRRLSWTWKYVLTEHRTLPHHDLSSTTGCSEWYHEWRSSHVRKASKLIAPP